jgi:hypothetical protein
MKERKFPFLEIGGLLGIFSILQYLIFLAVCPLCVILAGVFLLIGVVRSIASKP